MPRVRSDRKLLAGGGGGGETVRPKQVSILATLTFRDMYFNVDRTASVHCGKTKARSRDV